jgi:uncharacterized protein YbbC (DUF1343 family)
MLPTKPNNPSRRGKNISLLLIPFFSLFLLWCVARSADDSLSQERTILGNETFTDAFPPELQTKKLGLVLNHTSVLAEGKLLVNALQERGIRIHAIFSPEHGFKGKKEAGANVQDDRWNSIKIFSLYGKTKKPTADQIQIIDAFVYDIQDVGTRFYTYITTLKYILEAAAEAEKSVYVLDRPNPVGGQIVEGPLLLPEYESFYGSLPIPVRYGLTAGELALMMKGEGWVPPQVDLHVINMKNWKRRFFWEDTGLGWIPTSPNIPTPETAIIYPGTGLLGALNLNHGLGTLNPFLQFGTPWLDTKAIIQKLRGGSEFGVELESLTYTPRSLPGKTLHPPFENRICQGILVRLIQRDRFLSIRFTLELIKAIKELHPGKIVVYRDSLNRHFGNQLLERYILDKLSYEELLRELEKDERFFLEKRKKYLLYD